MPQPAAETEQKVINRPNKDDLTKKEEDELSKPFVIPPPFPERFALSKRRKEEKEILEIFHKVEVNIPLLDTIKQIPRYAKFLKELCTNKKKLAGNEKISVGENVSAVLQRKIPPKCKDQGMFAIPCKIGNVGVEKAMCDLGAAINVMPMSIYSSMNASPLKKTGVIIQLADRSIVYPKGVLEDVLVQVNGLVFPADFYVIDMEKDRSVNSSDILLGRPFLSTARTKIDVYDGTLTMEFDGEQIKFNVYDAMKYPNEVSCVNGVDIIDPCIEQTFEMHENDKLKDALCGSYTKNELKEIQKDVVIDDELQEVVAELEEFKPMRYAPPKLDLPTSDSKLLPSVVQAPILELKEIPYNLKYAYLGDGKTLPVIIPNELNSQEEERLIQVLKEHKEVIGWTIANIKGLSPSKCMHPIILEEDIKPFRQAKRRLNPP